MQWSHHRCLFLLVLGGLCFVTGNIISGCSGDSVKLFPNISFSLDNIVVTLYKNGKNYTLVGMWSKADNDAVKETLENGYNDRVNIDKHGNLWLHNVGIADEAKYTLIFAIKDWSLTIGVQLVVLVAPSAACIPKIKHVNNTLIAELDKEDCGSPAASTYWLNHSGLVHENNVAKLTQGKEAGTYHACIKSPALYCARKSEPTDLCKDFTVHEKITLPTLPSLPELTTGASESHSASPQLIATIVTGSLMSLLLVIILIILLKYTKKIQSLRAAEDKNVLQRSTRVSNDEETGNPIFSSPDETQISIDEGTSHTNAGSKLETQISREEETRHTNAGSELEIQSLRAAENENVLQMSTRGSNDEETGNPIFSSPDGEESPLLREEDAQSSAPGNLSGENLSSSFKGVIRLISSRPKSTICQ